MDDECTLILQAFWFLSAGRPIGWGPGTIPLTEIIAYTDLYDLPDARWFAGVIRELDVVYLNHCAEHKPKPKDEKPKGKRR